MFRSKKSVARAMLLLAAIVFATPTPAHALFQIQVYDDGKLELTSADFSGSSGAVLVGKTTHFDLHLVTGLTNNPGTPTFANLDLTDQSRINATFGTGGGKHIVKIELTSTDFTAPPGTPLLLTSSAGGSYVGTLAGNKVDATYQGFLDPTNKAYGKPGAGSTPLQTASAVALLPPPQAAPLVFAPPTAIASVASATPFSMTDVLTLAFTIGVGSGQDTANVAASTVAAVPAPAGIVLALTGLPFLGIGQWLRRRSKSS